MIAAFVADRMARYLAGGMDADTAADFTRGELSAIYEGSHYSRDASGALRATPPPESLAPETAMAKCDAVIGELLKTSAENAGTESTDTQGTAPEAPPRAQGTQSGAKGNGLEGLKNYVRRKTA